MAERQRADGGLVVGLAASIINLPPVGPSSFPLTLFHLKINNKMETI